MKKKVEREPILTVFLSGDNGKKDIPFYEKELSHLVYLARELVDGKFSKSAFVKTFTKNHKPNREDKKTIQYLYNFSRLAPELFLSTRYNLIIY